MYSSLGVLLLTLLLASFNPSVLGSPLLEQGASNSMYLTERPAQPLSTSDTGLTLPKPRIQENKKRVFSSAIEDWRIHIDEWDFARPFPRASDFLYFLYREVWRTVNYDLQFRNELDHFSILHGPFRMRFDCEQGPIEWSQVAFIAYLLANAAAMGWEGLYQLRFQHLRSPVIISVSLTVLWFGGGG